MSYQKITISDLNVSFKVWTNESSDILNMLEESIVYYKLIGYSLTIKSNNKQIALIFKNNNQIIYRLVLRLNLERKLMGVCLDSVVGFSKKSVDAFLSDAKIDFGKKHIINFQDVHYAQSYIKEGMINIFKLFKYIE